VLKYLESSELMENRIRRGDYAIRELPTEQELARELGVSRKTARRAILRLIGKQLVVRKPYGRLAVNGAHAMLNGRLQLAFLAVAFYSQISEIWRCAVDRAARKIGAVVRPVEFVHWDDPVIPEVLTGFDGVFLMPGSETIPPTLLERFGQARHLVSLENDLSDVGVPSVHLLPPRFIHCLGDHLYQLGHRHIDCLNSQPPDRVIQRRAEQWLLWQRMHKVEGRLINEPVRPFEPAAPKAYRVMKRLLGAGAFKATALVCLTNEAATGAIRALHEKGLQAGKDVSVCAMEGAAMARLQCPSRTVLEPPEPDLYVEVCVDWFAKRTEPWVGPPLMEPSTLPLFKGESTGPAPVRAARARRRT